MEIKKSIRPVIENIIAQYLPLAMGGLVLILAWLTRQLQLWQILLLGLVVSMVVIWLIIGISVFREKRKKNLTKLSDRELQTTILEWISIPAWSTRPLDLKNDLLLGYELTFAPNHSISISRQKKEPLIIYLAVNINLSSEKTTLSSDEWERVGGQISIEMARLGINFSFPDLPNSWGKITLLEPVILDNALTGYDFRLRIIFVIRAVILILEVWKEALRLSERSTAGKEESQR